MKRTRTRRMKLTRDNYYSSEANRAYWSASFVKAMLRCPAAALAELRGEYRQPETPALLVGSYVDSYFESTEAHEAFCTGHPQIFGKSGKLKAEYVQADKMIRRAEEDSVFMEYLRGEKQVIRTGAIDGIPFKAKLDVYLPGERIVDLKTVRDMEPVYSPGQGRISFAEYWNWPMQLAIYQELCGEKVPCYLAVITKQDPPDIAVVQIPQNMLDAEMELLRLKLPYLDAVRQGIVEPERCGKCTWCRQSKELTGAVSLEQFIEIS